MWRVFGMKYSSFNKTRNADISHLVQSNQVSKALQEINYCLKSKSDLTGTFQDISSMDEIYRYLLHSALDNSSVLNISHHSSSIVKERNLRALIALEKARKLNTGVKILSVKSAHYYLEALEQLEWHLIKKKKKNLHKSSKKSPRYRDSQLGSDDLPILNAVIKEEPYGWNRLHRDALSVYENIKSKEEETLLILRSNVFLMSGYLTRDDLANSWEIFGRLLSIFPRDLGDNKIDHSILEQIQRFVTKSMLNSRYEKSIEHVVRDLINMKILTPKITENLINAAGDAGNLSLLKLLLSTMQKFECGISSKSLVKIIKALLGNSKEDSKIHDSHRVKSFISSLSDTPKSTKCILWTYWISQWIKSHNYLPSYVLLNQALLAFRDMIEHVGNGIWLESSPDVWQNAVSVMMNAFSRGENSVMVGKLWNLIIEGTLYENLMMDIPVKDESALDPESIFVYSVFTDGHNTLFKNNAPEISKNRKKVHGSILAIYIDSLGFNGPKDVLLNLWETISSSKFYYRSSNTKNTQFPLALNHYNSFIEAFCRNGHYDLALEVLKELEIQGYLKSHLRGKSRNVMSNIEWKTVAPLFSFLKANDPSLFRKFNHYMKHRWPHLSHMAL